MRVGIFKRILAAVVSLAVAPLFGQESAVQSGAGAENLIESLASKQGEIDRLLDGSGNRVFFQDTP